MIGVVLLYLDPSNPAGPGLAAVVFLVVVALPVGAQATVLTARAVGRPLRDLRRAVQRVGAGDYDVDVVVDDVGRSVCCRRASTPWPPASRSGSGCATSSAGTSGRRWPSGRWRRVSR
jgi:HAMP domain